MLQLSSTLNRIAVEKRRNIRVTLFEYCSHLIIIGILVLGYGLSNIYYYQSQKYDVYQVMIPPVAEVTAPTMLDAFSELLEGPLPVPSLDSYILASSIVSEQFQSDSKYESAVRSSSTGHQYANLINFGDIHLAPYPSAEVDSYMLYLNQVRSSKLFQVA
jgi:hypothetical protein